MADKIKRPTEMTREGKIVAGAIMLAFQRCALMAANCPTGGEMYRRTYNPQPGDLVVEASTLHMLVRCADTSDDRWDGQFVTFSRNETVMHKGEEEDDEWAETVLVCIKPNGKEFRWTNASLLAVPDRCSWPKGQP